MPLINWCWTLHFRGKQPVSEEEVKSLYGGTHISLDYMNSFYGAVSAALLCITYTYMWLSASAHCLCVSVLCMSLCLSVSLSFSSFVCGGGIWCHSIVIHSLCVIFIFDVTPRRKRAVWGEVRGRTDCLSLVLSQKEWNSGTSGCGLFVVACFQPAPSITINLLHMNISFCTLLSLAGNWDHFNWLKPVLNWPNVSSRT